MRSRSQFASRGIARLSSFGNATADFHNDALIEMVLPIAAQVWLTRFGFPDCVVCEKGAERSGSAVVKANQHLVVRWSFHASRGKVQHRSDLFASQVEPLDDIFYAGARFKVLEKP
jgi:hypothetical protein